MPLRSPRLSCQLGSQVSWLCFRRFPDCSSEEQRGSLWGWGDFGTSSGVWFRRWQKEENEGATKRRRRNLAGIWQAQDRKDSNNWLTAFAFLGSNHLLVDWDGGSFGWQAGRPAAHPDPCQLLAASVAFAPSSSFLPLSDLFPWVTFFPWSSSVGKLTDRVCGQLFIAQAWDACSNMLAFEGVKHDRALYGSLVVWKEFLLQWAWVWLGLGGVPEEGPLSQRSGETEARGSC